MTKDDLMQIAEQSGASIMKFNDGRMCAGDIVFYDGCLERFANAILERAAVECDDKYQVRAEGGFPREAACARSLAIEIRALKIPEGE